MIVYRDGAPVATKELTDALAKHDAEVYHVFRNQVGIWYIQIIQHYSPTSDCIVSTYCDGGVDGLLERYSDLAAYLNVQPKGFDMANIYKSDLFKYMEGVMVKDKPTAMTIRNVREERIEFSGQKRNSFVVYFNETNKGAVMNKTNAKVLASFFGPETDDWAGERVVLYAVKGRAFGEEGWWLRMRPESAKEADMIAAIDELPERDVFDDLDDDEE